MDLWSRPVPRTMVYAAMNDTATVTATVPTVTMTLLRK